MKLNTNDATISAQQNRCDSFTRKNKIKPWNEKYGRGGLDEIWRNKGCFDRSVGSVTSCPLNYDRPSDKKTNART